MLPLTRQLWLITALLSVLVIPLLSQCPLTSQQADIIIGQLSVTSDRFTSGNLTITNLQDTATYNYTLAKPFSSMPNVATSLTDLLSEYSLSMFLEVKPVVNGLTESKRKAVVTFLVRTEWKYTAWKMVRFGFVAEERKDVEVGVFEVETAVLGLSEESKEIQVYLPFRAIWAESPTVVTFLTGFQITAKMTNGQVSPIQLQQRQLSKNTTGFSLALSITSITTAQNLLISYIAYDSHLHQTVHSSLILIDDFIPKQSSTSQLTLPPSLSSQIRTLLHGLTSFILTPRSPSLDFSLTTSYTPGNRQFTFLTSTNMFYLGYSYFTVTGNVCKLCQGYAYFYLNSCVDKCPTGTYTLKDTCVSCGQGMGFNGSQCVTVCTGGRVWNAVVKQCQCPQNLYWTGVSCVTCPAGQVFNIITAQCQCMTGYWNGNSCVLCQGNQVFNGVTLTCQCSIGTFWNGTYCTTCTGNSTWSPSTLTCICLPGTQWNGMACVSCGQYQVWNSNSLKCECLNGYKMELNGSCSPIKCQQNQVYNGTQCISLCPINTYYNGTQCITITPTCPAGMIYTSNQCIFPQTSCPTSMTWTGQSCTSAPNCTFTYGTFYWNGSACVQLSQRCPCPLEWRNNMCLPSNNQCPQGTYYNGYLCVSYTACDQRMVWNSTLAKCVCQKGMLWNGVKCMTCPDGMVYAGSDGCTCPQGTTWNNSKCVASSQQLCKSMPKASWNGTHCVCLPGYTAINGRCVCYGLQLTNWCNRCYLKPNSYFKDGLCVCLDTFVEYNGSCVKPQSIQRTSTPAQQTCGVATYFDHQLKQCLPCPAGCLSCLNCYKCMQCAVGFVYNPQSELCEEICGDGLRFNLKCDDGNNVNGDGCAMDCRVEEGWTCEGGSPDRKDTCTIFKPTQLTIQMTSQAHLYGKVIINIKVNYLPSNLTTLLTQPNCSLSSCFTLFTTTITSPSQSPVSTSIQYIGGAYHTFSLQINFKKQPIDKFTLSVSIKEELKVKYFPSIDNGKFGSLKVEIQPMFMAMYVEKDYIR